MTSTVKFRVVSWSGQLTFFISDHVSRESRRMEEKRDAKKLCSTGSLAFGFEGGFAAACDVVDGAACPDVFAGDFGPVCFVVVPRGPLMASVLLDPADESVLGCVRRTRRARKQG